MELGNIKKCCGLDVDVILYNINVYITYVIVKLECTVLFISYWKLKLDFEAALIATLPIMDTINTALFCFVIEHVRLQEQFYDKYCLQIIFQPNFGLGCVLFAGDALRFGFPG